MYYHENKQAVREDVLTYAKLVQSLCWPSSPEGGVKTPAVKPMSCSQMIWLPTALVQKSWVLTGLVFVGCPIARLYYFVGWPVKLQNPAFSPGPSASRPSSTCARPWRRTCCSSTRCRCACRPLRRRSGLADRWGKMMGTWIVIVILR